MAYENQAPTAPTSQPNDANGSTSVTDAAQKAAATSTAQTPAPIPSATPTPSPTAASAVGTPAAQKVVATPPRPQPSLHQSWFSKFLEIMSGGPKFLPVRDANGNYTGAVQQIHPTKKALGASILAGALSSMMAGMMAPDARNAFGGRDLSPSAQAGAQAGMAQVDKTSRAGAQALADQQLTRQFAITDHNLKTHALMLQNQALQGQVQKQSVDDAEPMIQGLSSIAAQNPKAIYGQHITGPELEQLIRNGTHNITMDSALPDDLVPAYDPVTGEPLKNPDGTPKMEYTYTVYDPTVLLPMTKDLQKLDPAFASVATGQKVPIRAFAKAWLRRGQITSAQDVVNGLAQKVDEVNGAKTPTKIDLQAEIAKRPSLLKIVPMLGQYAGQDPDEVLDAMRKQAVNNPAMAQAVGAFQNMLGIDETTWKNFRREEQKRIDQEANPDKRPADDAYINSQVGAINSLKYLPEDQKLVYLQQLKRKDMTQGDADKIVDKAIQSESTAIYQSLIKQKADATLGTLGAGSVFDKPDSFGFQPSKSSYGVTDAAAIKGYNSRMDKFKKNADETVKTLASYQQFRDILSDIDAGKDMTGAQSVVGLFNAIGLSATPLAGRGFRINNNVIEEHRVRRGWLAALQASLQNAERGQMITNQQLRDYTSIAEDTFRHEVVNAVNLAHSEGLNADFLLPKGNGAKIDMPTLKIFMELSGNDSHKAAAAVRANGWQL